MSNNKFAQKAFALTLGAVLALGTVPAFAYAHESGPTTNGKNSAGSNSHVDGQTEDPGWFDKNGNPIDKDGNPIKEDKGSDSASDNGSNKDGSEVPGVKSSWEVREILETARNFWHEMYPEAEVPNGLFDFVSGGVTFPEDEPATHITIERELNTKKEVFVSKVKEVYPDTTLPKWLITDKGDTSLKHDYPVNQTVKQSDVTAEVKDSSDEQALLSRMREIWKELYPEADAPLWLFDKVSSGVNFPTEPKCYVDDDYKAYELKKEFLELFAKVYPGVDVPNWLFGNVSQ